MNENTSKRAWNKFGFDATQMWEDPLFPYQEDHLLLFIFRASFS